jgi:hypothetical protein
MVVSTPSLSYAACPHIGPALIYYLLSIYGLPHMYISGRQHMRGKAVYGAGSI